MMGACAAWSCALCTVQADQQTQPWLHRGRSRKESTGGGTKAAGETRRQRGHSSREGTGGGSTAVGAEPQYPSCCTTGVPRGCPRHVPKDHGAPQELEAEAGQRLALMLQSVKRTLRSMARLLASTMRCCARVQPGWSTARSGPGRTAHQSVSTVQYRTVQYCTLLQYCWPPPCAAARGTTRIVHSPFRAWAKCTPISQYSQYSTVQSQYSTVHYYRYCWPPPYAAGRGTPGSWRAHSGPGRTAHQYSTAQSKYSTV